MLSLAEQPALSKHSTNVMVAQVFGEHPSVSNITHMRDRLPFPGLERILSPYVIFGMTSTRTKVICLIYILICYRKKNYSQDFL